MLAAPLIAAQLGMAKLQASISLSLNRPGDSSLISSNLALILDGRGFYLDDGNGNFIAAQD